MIVALPHISPSKRRTSTSRAIVRKPSDCSSVRNAWLIAHLLLATPTPPLFHCCPLPGPEGGLLGSVGCAHLDSSLKKSLESFMRTRSVGRYPASDGHDLFFPRTSTCRRRELLFSQMDVRWLCWLRGSSKPKSRGTIGARTGVATRATSLCRPQLARLDRRGKPHRREERDPLTHSLPLGCSIGRLGQWAWKLRGFPQPRGFRLPPL